MSLTTYSQLLDDYKKNLERRNYRYFIYSATFQQARLLRYFVICIVASLLLSELHLKSSIFFSSGIEESSRKSFSIVTFAHLFIQNFALGLSALMFALISFIVGMVASGYLVLTAFIWFCTVEENQTSG